MCKGPEVGYVWSDCFLPTCLSVYGSCVGICIRSKCKFDLSLVDNTVSCSLEDVYNGSVLSYDVESKHLFVCGIYFCGGGGLDLENILHA